MLFYEIKIVCHMIVYLFHLPSYRRDVMRTSLIMVKLVAHVMYIKAQEARA